MSFLKKRSPEDFTNSLARYLPNDETFASKNIPDSTLRKLLRALSVEFGNANDFLDEYVCDSRPTSTGFFLEAWERDLGIPDECFLGNGTREERARDVFIKWARMNVQTLEDMRALADLFDVTLTIDSGTSFGAFQHCFPIQFFEKSVDARFTLIVNAQISSVVGFPIPFPIPFGYPLIGFVQCILEEAKPSNVQLLFNLQDNVQDSAKP